MFFFDLGVAEKKHKQTRENIFKKKTLGKVTVLASKIFFNVDVDCVQ